MVELFEMGASIMLLPSIAYLKKQNPEVEIHCLTTRTCLPVWKAVEAIDLDRIHVIESGSPMTFLWSAFKVLLKLRKTSFDLIVDYELFMRISALFIGVLRARRRAGFYKYKFEGLERGEFYETRCAYNQNSHISRNYLALTKAGYERAAELPNLKSNIAFDEIAVEPMLKPRAQNAKRLRPEPYIAVCPDVGKTLAVRNYPRPHFAKVVQALLEKYPRHKVVMIGTEENSETADDILGQVALRERCENLCGKTNFTELLDLIAGAELLITNDNGPGHFATLTGTKTLALFSTDSPYVYGPLGDAVIAYTNYQCSPCISAYNHKASACDNNLCLQSLAPERVIDLASRILEGKASFRTINDQVPYLY